MKNQAKLSMGSFWLPGLIIFIFFSMSPLSTYATDYYFSSLRGDDSHSVSSSTNPWGSASKLQTVINQLQAGDAIYLERGSVWYEVDLTVQNKDGNSGAPIRIAAFGSGEKPVLSGGKNLTGTFTKEGDLWTSYQTGFAAHDYIVMPAGVLIEDKFYAISRHPNDSYYWTESKGNGYLYDASRNWTANEMVGGQLVARCVGWAWSVGEITGNSTNEINFTKFSDFFLGQGHSETAYYLQNTEQGSDLKGEWCFNSNNIKINYPTDINTKQVEFSVVDTLMRLNQCDYLEIEDIEFRSANGILLDVQNGSHINIKSCEFRVTGFSAIYVNGTSYFDAIGNHFEYVHGNSITADHINVSNMNDNSFFMAPGTRGQWNYSPAAGRVGACITSYYGDGPLYVRNNEFDSVMIAFQSHWTNSSYWFENNIIRDYGVILGDIAGVYLGGDWKLDVKKYIRKNIFVDAHSHLESNVGGHLANYVHAIYWDYDTHGAICDSNTIVNTNAAVYSNKAYGNRFNGNNVYNAAKDVNSLWSSAIYLDANIDGQSGPKLDTFNNNNFVFGEFAGERAFLWHNVDEGGFEIKNNTYVNPFNSNTDIHRLLDQYSEAGNFTKEEVCARDGYDCSSSFNSSEEWLFSSVPTGEVNREDFVNVVYNDSNSPRYIKLDAEYVDMDGKIVRDSVEVEPWYSKILFFKSKVEDVNDPPLINNRVIDISEADFSGTTIVDLEVSDPDYGQTHSFQITAGNSSGFFEIAESTGVISFVSAAINFEGNPVYSLTVKVTDNGSPSMSDDAVVTINLHQAIAEDANHAPTIEAGSFVTNYDVSLPEYLGYVEANDEDDGQQLEFSIVSGNMDGHFEIDSYTGELSVISLPADNQPVTYNLIISVSDDDASSLSAEATVTVYISASDRVFYIDPDNSGDESRDGSYDHPFASWSEVEWIEDATYLQRCGTVANEEKILIGARGVTLGDYGAGEKPVIKSSADDYAIKAIDKDMVTIKNLEINSELAIGCVYFLGPSCVDNAVENCELIGADYGLRMIDGDSYVVKYNVFQNRVDGIYSIAEDAEIYYNVFKGNYKAINLGSYSSYAKIYNNVFYDNREGVSSSYAEITLFNNIFYMTQAGDRAINYKLDKMVSNNNIFFPEQDGFLEVNEKSYNTLDEFQGDFGLDMNSFCQDPKFVDVYEDNFSVEESSGAIDAGRIVGLTQDFMGQEVPYGRGPDIGTVETPAEAALTSVDYFENDMKISFSVYPNPTQGRVNIKFQNNIQGTKEVMVHSVKGQQIYSESFEIDGNFVTEVDLDGLPLGVYYVTVRSGDEVLTQKVVKN